MLEIDASDIPKVWKKLLVSPKTSTTVPAESAPLAFAKPTEEGHPKFSQDLCVFVLAHGTKKSLDLLKI